MKRAIFDKAREATENKDTVLQQLVAVKASECATKVISALDKLLTKFGDAPEQCPLSDLCQWHTENCQDIKNLIANSQICTELVNQLTSLFPDNPEFTEVLQALQFSDAVVATASLTLPKLPEGSDEAKLTEAWTQFQSVLRFISCLSFIEKECSKLKVIVIVRNGSEGDAEDISQDELDEYQARLDKLWGKEDPEVAKENFEMKVAIRQAYTNLDDTIKQIRDKIIECEVLIGAYNHEIHIFDVQNGGRKSPEDPIRVPKKKLDELNKQCKEMREILAAWVTRDIFDEEVEKAHIRLPDITKRAEDAYKVSDLKENDKRARTKQLMVILRLLLKIREMETNGEHADILAKFREQLLACQTLLLANDTPIDFRKIAEIVAMIRSQFSAFWVDEHVHDL